MPPATYHVGDYPHSVAVGDFTNNGNLDIVSADNGDNPGAVSVLLGNGDGTFRPDPFSPAGSDPGTFPVDAFPFAVAVGSLTPDGNSDIVTSDGDTVSVLLGLGDGAFAPTVTYPIGLSNGLVYVADSLPNVALGDFTGNGLDDIVTADPYIYNPTTQQFTTGEVSVFLGDGDGTFSPAVSYPVGNDAVFVAVGDFNGDGHLDIVTANEADNTVSVLLGDGNGGFSPDPDHSPGLPAGTFAVGFAPVSVAVGDFTGDGHLDIVTANAGDNTVSVLLGDGQGNFQAAVSYTVGSSPSAVTVGDLTGNGRRDIVTTNQDDATVSVLLGNGHGALPTRHHLSRR